MLSGSRDSLLPESCSFCSCVKLPMQSGSCVSVLPAKLSSCRNPLP